MSNREIRQLFSLYAELLLLHETDERLSDHLSRAAYRLRNLPEEVVGLSKAARSAQFRPDITVLLDELTKTGNIAALDELIQLTPPGLFEMMRIKGLGGKKLSVLWRSAKIDTLEGLLQAAKVGLLRSIAGFGAKTESNIIAAIETYQSGRHRLHYADVADAADRLVAGLQQVGKTKLVSLCGEVRRQSTTVASIEIIATLDHKKLTGAAMKKILVVEKSDKKESTAHTLEEIPVKVYHTSAENYYRDLFSRTGSEAHVQKVLARVIGKQAFPSESAIYEKAKMNYVVPEMREDNAEWDFTFKADDLVNLADIKGVVHSHTDYSDGVDSLQEFANACRKKGYEYTVISDHSKNAHYAGGLKEEKLLRQIQAIDALNKKMGAFRIFKSVECDILISGDLDYDASILKQLDLVIISVHQLLKMDEAKATKRLIRAIENPYTTILGHMTGRQLLIRPGYPVDFTKVIDACAANQVVIEINANPYRLDMDWSHIPYAMKKGVMISINPDAHSIAEIGNIRWGVAAARKGGLVTSMTWNAQSLKQIETFLKRRHKRK